MFCTMRSRGNLQPVLGRVRGACCRTSKRDPSKQRNEDVSIDSHWTEPSHWTSEIFGAGPWKLVLNEKPKKFFLNYESIVITGCKDNGRCKVWLLLKQITVQVRDVTINEESFAIHEWFNKDRFTDSSPEATALHRLPRKDSVVPHSSERFKGEAPIKALASRSSVVGRVNDKVDEEQKCDPNWKHSDSWNSSNLHPGNRSWK